MFFGGAYSPGHVFTVLVNIFIKRNHNHALYECHLRAINMVVLVLGMTEFTASAKPLVNDILNNGC